MTCHPTLAARVVAVLSMLAAAAAGLPPEKPLTDFAVARWTVDDGLPSDTLLNVVQTADGHLWIASFVTLARFDGLTFEAFEKKDLPEPVPNGYYELVEHDGRLWIGTQDGGVWLYEDDRFRPLDPTFRATVRSLLIDRSGTVWAGTSDTGLHRHVDGAFAAVEHPAIADVTVRALLEDQAGALWVGTEGKGLTRLDGDGTRTYDDGDGLAGNNVTSLLEDDDGALWIGTQAGLSRLADGAATGFPELDGVEVFRLYGDRHGSVWLATQRGVFRRTGRGFEHFPWIGVTALGFDHEGSAWLATYSHGLLQLKESKFDNVTMADGLATAKINCVTETRDGRLLAGADDGTVNVIRDGEVSRLALRTRLGEVRVRHLHEDAAGVLWISSYAGLLRVDGDRERLFTTADGLPSNQVRWAKEDRRGDLWIGTRNGGLARRRADGGFDVVDQAAGLSSDFVFALEEDADGNLILGTHEGLNVLAPDGAVTTYTIADGLPGNLVFNVFVDDAGAVWMATNGGLARLLDGEIRAVTSRDGLPADSVFDYREDGLGYAWMSSATGVVRVDEASLEDFLAGRRPDFESWLFDDRDGMADRECSGATGFLRARDGRMWFPTLGGLSVIDPAVIPFNPVPPPVTLDRLTAGGETIPLDRGPVEIEPGLKRFTFEFSALSFLAPTRVTVRYRLTGFDDDWIDAGAERAALYTGLPHGEYTFDVVAANNDGVWNEQGASLAFRVRPFFHQTPTFYTLLAVALIAGLRAAYRRRVATIERRNARLQTIVAEQRRAELEKERLIRELGSRNKELELFNYTLSHDLKSPLVTIQGFLGLLEKDTRAGDADRLRDDMRHIREAVAAMGRLLEDLPHLSRLGGATRQPLDLGELAREAVDRAAPRIRERGVEVTIADDLPPAAGDRDQLLDVVESLLDNALKFSDGARPPRVEIGWRHDDREVVYLVRDNGRGVEPRYHEKIFEPFEKLVYDTEGTGLGLAIARRVIEGHGGRIWVESEGVGRGAALCFTLPPESL